MSLSNLSMVSSGGRAILQGSSKLSSRLPRPQVQLEQAQQQQAYLAARVERINATIEELYPRTAAVKDPEARREVELRLKGLARHGLFVTETWRKLDAILAERERAL
ncbi:unnamed protein product [Ectocarpus sp. 12 AP-2014]